MGDGFRSLSGHLVSNAPASIYYLPNFISEEEEAFLLDKVYSAPKPKWTQLAHRKLQNWGGLPHPKGMITEPLPPWLQTYTEKISSLDVFGGKAANHVLVNEYLPGQGIMPHEDGPLFYPVVSTISLGSHTLLDFYYHQDNQNFESQDVDIPETRTEPPLSAQSNHEDTLSETSFENRYFTSVLIEPRSLILVCDDMYKIHLHGIAERTEDRITNQVSNLSMTQFSKNDILKRNTRVSLTIRHVPKILKSKLFFGKKK